MLNSSLFGMKDWDEANMAGSDGDNFVPQIKEPAGQKKKKPPKKASAPVKDEEEEVADPKDCLAAYNLGDSSPEHSAREIGKQRKGKKGRNGPNKKGATKKGMSSLAKISNEEIAEPHHESEDGGLPCKLRKKLKEESLLPKSRRRLPSKRGHQLKAKA
ncbi:uncharacterized protein [Triticum aestivum]|uniref:uncharacterized protein n=1 Tax=Triticum aestivum TaxID=4565 RepID=UPI001D001D33|nr:uncharacterized protein LOC123061173 [Triticum aestivum]XP_044340053.1 uncharacterized protein LOC123061173 [Triticum aestivum]XP_044340054.1 uncharacterized protein LOC123061173 [Triticum aestivum]XP_044340055.1 uncharacterized protein LOC123061173 [Triticum aestivum]XP_044340056.1 uncharacterized protein LOC123061173 [Triticum aestivum]